MTNKAKRGRKYDRAKWGWKDESQLQKYSPHPYYDSDRKQKTEEFSIKVILGCIILMVFLATLLIFHK